MLPFPLGKENRFKHNRDFLVEKSTVWPTFSRCSRTLILTLHIRFYFATSISCKDEKSTRKYAD